MSQVTQGCDFCILLLGMDNRFEDGLTEGDWEKFQVHLRIAHGWTPGELPGS